MVEERIFPFLHDHGGYASKLAQLFCNSISLGMWERARAAAHSLCKLQWSDDTNDIACTPDSHASCDPLLLLPPPPLAMLLGSADEDAEGDAAAAVDILELILALIHDPNVDIPPHSVSIPSRYHLAWLAAQLYEELRTDFPQSQEQYQTLPDSLVAELEFNLFIEVLVDAGANRGTVSLVRSGSSPSSTAVAQLIEALAEQPLLIARLGQLLTLRNARDDASLALRLQRQCVESLLALIKDNQTDQIYKRLLAIDTDPSAVSERSVPLGALAESLAFACTRGTLALDAVAAALLGSTNGRALLAKTLSHRDRAICATDNPMADITVHSRDWPQIFHFSRRHATHFFERTLETGLADIDSRDFARIESLFATPGLDSLAPLLLLMGWNRVADNDEHTAALLRALLPLHSPSPTIPNANPNPNPNPIDPLTRACRLLDFHARLVAWCRDRSATADPIPSRDLYTLIKSQTPLQVIHQAVDLRRVPESDVLALLSEAHPSNTVVYRSYRILVTLAHAFANAHQNHDDAFATTRVALLALDIPQRLSLLEDAFSFLFAREHDHFVATAPLVSSVLDLIRDSLTDIETSPTVRPADQTRLAALRRRANEARWRLALVSRLKSPDEPSSSSSSSSAAASSLLPRMLSNPLALLSMCLRADAYDRAREVIRMFELDTQLDDHVTVAKSFDAIATHLERDPANATAAATSDIDTALSLAPLTAPLDIALCFAAHPDLSRSLLDRLDTTTDRDTTELTTLLCALLDSFPTAPLSALLTGVDAQSGLVVPLESAEQVCLFNEQQALRRSALDAHNAHEQPDAEALFAAFGDGVLVDFVRHLDRLTELLTPSQDDTQAILNVGPTDTICRLAFTDGNLDLAELVARACGKDLVQLLVRRCCLTDTLTPEIVSFLRVRAPLLAALAVVARPTATFTDISSAVRDFSQVNRAVQALCAPVCASADDFAVPSVITLLEATSSERERLITAVVDALFNAGRAAEALLVADQCLAGGAPDFLLCAAADARSSTQPAWHYVGRLRDKNIASSFLFKHMRDWPIDVCLDLLRMCDQHLPSDSLSRARVQESLEEMEVYSLVVAKDPSRWHDWQMVATARQTDAASLISDLAATDDYPLAVRLARMCDGSKSTRLLRMVEERELRTLLDRGDTFRAHAVLQAMGNEDAFRVAADVLASVTSREQRLVVVQFMLNFVGAQLPPQHLKRLEQLEVGLRAIDLLPAALRPACEHLYHQPALLLEQLVMNLLLDVAANVIVQLPKIQDVELMARYADKALEFPALPEPIIRAPSLISRRGTSSSFSGSVDHPGGSAATRGTAAGSGGGNPGGAVINIAPPPLVLKPQSQWVPDDKADVCMVCKDEAFGLFSRRHHCRLCGRVVCTNCSAQPMVHPQHPEPLRCCDECHESYARTKIQMRTATTSASASPLKRKTGSDSPMRGLPSSPGSRAHLMSTAPVTPRRSQLVLTAKQREESWHGDIDEEEDDDGDDDDEEEDDDDVEEGTRHDGGDGRGQVTGGSMSASAREDTAGSSASRASKRSRVAGAKAKTPKTGAASGAPEDPFGLNRGVRPSAKTVDACGLKWVLYGDERVDMGTRRRFTFGHGASTTMSMAILDLIQDSRESASACLRLCDHLSEHLVTGDTRIDQFLVISMIRRLCFNAKLKFLDNGLHRGVERCDTYLGRVELLRALICGHCHGVLSIADLDEPDKARRLRDRLVSNDRMQLAMEVSTKCGLDPNPVWAAWGMSYLRLGRFTEAREMLRHCLTSREQPQASETVLNAVVECLESQPPIKAGDIKQLHKQLSAFHKGGQTDVGLELKIDALLNSFKARETRSGAFFPTSQQRRGVSTRSGLDTHRYDECLFYLRTYGSAHSILTFFMRHGLVDRACASTLDDRLSSESFVQDVFMTALATGRLSELKQAMLELDPSLDRWIHPYLMLACRQLNLKKMFRVLYDVQLFMRDFVRAAMTAVKMFQSSKGEVSEKIGLLKRVILHLDDSAESGNDTTATASPIGGGGSSERGSPVSASHETKSDAMGRLLMARDDIERYKVTVRLQIEITQILGDSASTLFGSDKQKMELAGTLVLREQYRLSSSIVKHFKLSSDRMYVQAAQKLARASDLDGIERLVNAVRDDLTREQVDAVLLSAVKVLSEMGDHKTAEILVARLHTEKSRISGFILCGKLKAAYLIAVRERNTGEIMRIRDAAAKLEQKMVLDLCDKYLKK